MVKEFMGAAIMGPSNGSAIMARRGGTVKKTVKKPVKKTVKKKSGTVVKKTAKKGVKKAGKGDFGPNRQVWLPGQGAEWLDGTMIGDRGFDPLGLAKPAEYEQIELDALDQNSAKNPSGRVIGKFVPDKTTVTTETLQPYNEVFDINRFRECELIHGRWCMVATLGALTAEAATGVSWVDAGKVELEGAQYLGLDLPYTVGQLVAIEVLLMGYIEIARSSELDNEKRCYPGGRFDPFGLADDPADAERLKLAEIKHSRLAMVAFFLFGVEALFQDNTSPLEAIGF